MPTLAFGLCKAHGINVWPRQGTLSPNNIIMIQGYAESQKVISRLNQRHTVYLSSSNHRVALLIQSTHVSTYHYTQAILKPAEPLKHGKKYTLIIDSLPPNESLTWYSSGEEVPVQWQVDKYATIANPLITNKPKVLKKSFERYGCGPASEVKFQLKANTNARHLVKVKLTDRVTGQSYIYYVPMSDQHVWIGHGMCAGSFKLRRGRPYTVKFQLMSATGALSNVSQPVRFVGPR